MSYVGLMTKLYFKSDLALDDLLMISSFPQMTPKKFLAGLLIMCKNSRLRDEWGVLREPSMADEKMKAQMSRRGSSLT